MDNTAAALDRLERIANLLSEQLPPEDRGPAVVPQGCWLDSEDARWLAQGIRRALDEPCRLDEAFGLKKRRGAPIDARRAALVCEVWAQLPEPTAKAIQNELQRRFPATFQDEKLIDDRQIRRYVGPLDPDVKDFEKLTLTARAALADEIERRRKEKERRT